MLFQSGEGKKEQGRGRVSFLAAQFNALGYHDNDNDDDDDDDDV